MSMKFERDERKFDFHDIGCEIKRKMENKVKNGLYKMENKVKNG